VIVRLPAETPLSVKLQALVAPVETDSVQLPKAVEPFFKVILPVGLTLPDAGLTVAVPVIDVPYEMLVVGMFSVVVVLTSAAAALVSAKIEELELNETVSLAVDVLAVTASPQLLPEFSVSDTGVLQPFEDAAAKVKSVATLTSVFDNVPVI
jgi:hypothetical protein